MFPTPQHPQNGLLQGPSLPISHSCPSNCYAHLGLRMVSPEETGDTYEVAQL